MATTVHGGCAHDCPDSCAWTVTVEDGRAVHLAGDAEHPYTRGVLCAKVNRYLDRVYSPDRVLHPLRRDGPKGEGRFTRVSWEEALSGIAERLKAVIAEHGPEAVLPYSYAGNMGLVQYRGMDRRFFARMGASRLDRTICGDTAGAGVAVALGTPTGMRPEQIVHSRLILLWGTNTLVTNAHLWPFVRQAREAGAQLVVIDPIRTRTAVEADWHVQPLPGTDAALALGMMRAIVDEGLQDEDYLERFCNGWPELRERMREYPLERCSDLTGLPAAEIARLGRLYATVRPSCIRTLVGAEKHPNGGRNFRTIACLPAVVGAWRERGGGLLHWTRSYFDEALDYPSLMGGLTAPRSRRISMIQVGRALTDPELAPPVKALVVYDANPAVIAPNQDQVLRGLAREDLFTVVSELFITDTARYADYVLPATSFLEHLDLLLPWGQTYVTLNQPAIDPLGECVSNAELFRRLAAAMGYGEAAFQESDEQMLRATLGKRHPYLEGISYESLRETGWAPLRIPEGLPFADGFPTPSGRCELFSEPSPAHLEPPASRLPLALVAAKTELHFLNSSYAQLPRHARAAEPFAVHLHPVDAEARGIADGDLVRAWSEFGSLELPARVGDRVRPGVVAIPHGHRGRSANALTSDGIADLGGGGDFFGTRVEVERREAPTR